MKTKTNFIWWFILIGMPLIGLSTWMYLGDPIVVICSVLFALGIVFAVCVWVYALSRIIDLPGEGWNC